MSARGRVWSAILLIAAIVRVLTLSAYPLHDTTEARYAEIARLMLISGDWITPQLEAGVPFWGKPPLSFWLTASSFQFFGLSEFAARLPAFLLLAAVIALIYFLARQVLSVETALGAATILLTSAIGFVASGAVMTDAPLLLGTTLSMVAFWKAVTEQKKRWGYLFFIGIAIGLLAKGPIALILTALPVILWMLCNRNLRTLRSLPWIPGFFLLIMLAAPWYVVAELKSPGFLEYFIVGEHWLRYVESGWAGDLYGSAHAQPRGAIWLFAIAAALPWSLLALYATGRFWQTRLTMLRRVTPFQMYLLLWTLTPLLVFTFAGNILPAYVLPGMPAFAILLSGWLAHQNRRILHVAWTVPMIIVAALLTRSIDAISDKSQKDLITHHATLVASDSSRSGSIVYFPVRPFSADFYSRGTALEIQSDSGLKDFLESPGTEFLAFHRNRLAALPAAATSCLRLEAEYRHYLLFEKVPAECHETSDRKRADTRSSLKAVFGLQQELQTVDAAVAIQRIGKIEVQDPAAAGAGAR